MHFSVDAKKLAACRVIYKHTLVNCWEPIKVISSEAQEIENVQRLVSNDVEPKLMGLGIKVQCKSY